MGCPTPITTPLGSGMNEPFGMTCSGPCRYIGTTGTCASTATYAKPFLKLKPVAPLPRDPDGNISTDQPLWIRSLSISSEVRLEAPARTNGTVPSASEAAAPLSLVV